MTAAARQKHLQANSVATDCGYASPCWLWQRHADKCGYGRVCIGKQGVKLAHRLAYEAFVGPIPEDLEIDHLCRQRSCVNPEHLEVVTHAENMRRSAPAQKTHCIHGHLYDEANTSRPDGHRRCLKCAAEYSRRIRAEKKALQLHRHTQAKTEDLRREDAA